MPLFYEYTIKPVLAWVGRSVLSLLSMLLLLGVQIIGSALIAGIGAMGWGVLSKLVNPQSLFWNNASGFFWFAFLALCLFSLALTLYKAGDR